MIHLNLSHIYHTSILNVPWFLFVLLFFLILMLLSTWKSNTGILYCMPYCMPYFSPWHSHLEQSFKKNNNNNNKNNVNLPIKKLTQLKWVCVNAVNNALNWQHYKILNGKWGLYLVGGPFVLGHTLGALAALGGRELGYADLSIARTHR